MKNITEKGILTNSSDNNDTWMSIASLKHWTYKNLSKSHNLIKNDMNKYQYNADTHLAKALLNKENTLCTGEEALLTVKSMHKII